MNYPYVLAPIIQIIISLSHQMKSQNELNLMKVGV